MKTTLASMARLNEAVLSAIIGGAILVGAAIGGGILSEGAIAAQLSSTWNYQYDAVGDGAGGKRFDIKGMAMSIQGDQLYVALTGGMPLSGVPEMGAVGGTISWGDLFFNPSGQSFQTAEQSGQLWGVRFAASNDSPVPLGVYAGVQSTSVAQFNNGFSTLQQYYEAGFGKANTQGSAIATTTQAYAYFGTGSVSNSIVGGTKVGDITPLTAAELALLNLNFGDRAGDQTIGFRFNQALIPSDHFVANVFLECLNDGMAFSVSAEAAPEPTTLVGAILGIGAIALRHRKLRR